MMMWNRSLLMMRSPLTVPSELEKKKPNSLEDRLHYYHGPELLLEKFHVEEQIEQLFDRKVELKSGAYFVIDYTEALTVVRY